MNNLIKLANRFKIGRHKSSLISMAATLNIMLIILIVYNKYAYTDLAFIVVYVSITVITALLYLVVLLYLILEAVAMNNLDKKEIDYFEVKDHLFNALLTSLVYDESEKFSSKYKSKEECINSYFNEVTNQDLLSDNIDLACAYEILSNRDEYYKESELKMVECKKVSKVCTMYTLYMLPFDKLPEKSSLLK